MTGLVYFLPVLECSAAMTAALSVWLAARRSLATWPTGILSCMLYAILFVNSKLYADATLQFFFIVTSVIGWHSWQRVGSLDNEVLISRDLSPRTLVLMLCAGIVVTLVYGSLLLQWTDAFAPFWDSSVLSSSVVAQLLLMQRRREAWPAWILVNSLSVPLYLSRELYVTAALYLLFWINAWYGWWYWNRAEGAAYGLENPAQRAPEV